MELLSNYSGICAIIVYSIILAFILKFSGKKEEKETETEIEEETQRTFMPLDLDDEDAMAACLVAAIECRNESHKNVRIVSVREV